MFLDQKAPFSHRILNYGHTVSLCMEACLIYNVSGAKVDLMWRWDLCALREGQTATVTKASCVDKESLSAHAHT